MPGSERYRLTIEAPAGDNRPGVVRLRAILKRLLRAFGLKCVTIRREPTEPEADR